MSTTVRIKEETHATLAQLAEESGETIQEVLAKAVEAYRRQRILAQTNAAYVALRKDQQAYEALLEERRAWEATLSDGLDEP
ncbi:MAG: toxin-antitoxin system protein [Anaerolineae bacterium]|jgi:predicted transcriptional regulator